MRQIRKLAVVAALFVSFRIQAHQSDELKSSHVWFRQGCEFALGFPFFPDLYQYDPSIGEALGIDRKTLDQTGLCGPVCAANAIYARFGSTRILNELMRILEFKELQMNIPREKVLESTGADELAYILYAALEELDGRLPEVEIQIEHVISPPSVEIPNITADSLRIANRKDAVVIALIHKNDIRFTPTTNQRGHYVLIEEVFDFKDRMLALIRDPSFQGSYWVEIEEYSRNSLGEAVYRFIDLKDMNYPWYILRDEAVSLVGSLIIARRNR